MTTTHGGGDVQYRAACGKCGARRVDQQIGLEPTPEEWVAKLVEVFRELRRVLRKDGVFFLEIGDSYAGVGRGPSSDTPRGLHENVRQSGGLEGAWAEWRPPSPGTKAKDLIGAPWLLAFALRADGWYLRSEIIWSKPNPMPESVSDRPTTAHSRVFLLTKSPRYYYDVEAIREPNEHPNRSGTNPSLAVHTQPGNTYQIRGGERKGIESNPSGRNRRSVWTIPTEPFSARALPGGAPRKVSPDCPVHGDRPVPAPTESDGERARTEESRIGRTETYPVQEQLDALAPTELHPGASSEESSSGSPGRDDSRPASVRSTQTRRTASRSSGRGTASEETDARTQGSVPSSESPGPSGSEDPVRSETPAYRPGICTCKASVTDHFATWPQKLVEPMILAGTSEGGVVLDPFAGSGTTLYVARRLGRRAIGIELSGEYCELAAKRLAQQSIFA